jgi:hypothetical protein
MAVTHDDKERVIDDYFRQHIGSTCPRTTSLNW